MPRMLIPARTAASIVAPDGVRVPPEPGALEDERCHRHHEDGDHHHGRNDLETPCPAAPPRGA